MSVTPASRAAWIVRTACARSGRPASESGMAPRPIGETRQVPIDRASRRVSNNRTSASVAARLQRVAAGCSTGWLATQVLAARKHAVVVGRCPMGPAWLDELALGAGPPWHAMGLRSLDAGHPWLVV